MYLGDEGQGYPYPEDVNSKRYRNRINAFDKVEEYLEKHSDDDNYLLELKDAPEAVQRSFKQIKGIETNGPREENIVAEAIIKFV